MKPLIWMLSISLAGSWGLIGALMLSVDINLIESGEEACINNGGLKRITQFSFGCVDDAVFHR